MKVATVNATKSKRLWAVYKLILTNINLKKYYNLSSISGEVRAWRSMGYPKQTKDVQRDNNLFLKSIEKTPVCPPRYV